MENHGVLISIIYYKKTFLEMLILESALKIERALNAPTQSTTTYELSPSSSLLLNMFVTLHERITPIHYQYL